MNFPPDSSFKAPSLELTHGDTILKWNRKKKERKKTPQNPHHYFPPMIGFVIKKKMLNSIKTISKRRVEAFEELACTKWLCSSQKGVTETLVKRVSSWHLS